MPAPAVIIELVQRFQDNRHAYQSLAYKEANLRLEFLDPFFAALGWDVYNRQGYAEAYKDVVVEDSIKIAGAVKAPDYAFRIGGTRKFFVEAKAPSTNIKEGIHPAYQLRRYAWSAKLPLSILTDFEELAVYDCRTRPDKKDKASAGRTMFFNFAEYPDRWDELAAIFSRDAVLKGSFDRYAESTRGKSGTAEVDDAFLSEIERWRELLARSIALRNPALSQRELNFAVQMTIDRLIFLRICEDRGIEFYGQLQALLNGGEVYARLCLLYTKADQRYNSGLFHFQAEKERSGAPDSLSLSLQIDDKPLKDIIASIYYPDSPYEFSVLPADILGQVYEQFLGKVIRLTAGHRAVVEEKPEVKKAGGVFYTPTYIVEYIVRHTLGELLKGKQPGQTGVGKGEPLRVLDPACGSGSFLLGAYQYLLDWYRDGYIADDPLKWAKGRTPVLYQSQNGEFRLTTSERKRILLDHIYGVDIDSQAVEVTKLSLLLKVLEGETEQTIGAQLSFFRQRALPDLGSNIKCGNSLIGPDFYAGQQLALLDLEEHYRINAFDWHTEFRQVFAPAPRSLWFVTFVTHNSRVSERMVQYGVESSPALVFTPAEQIAVAEKIAEACQKHSIAAVALNVLPDHVHMVLAAQDEEELNEHVRKIKGYSSHAFQQSSGNEWGHVWAQKFHRKPITDQPMLENVLNYVNQNHLKHLDQWGDRLLAAYDGLRSTDNGLKPIVPTPTPIDKGLKPLVPSPSPVPAPTEPPAPSIASIAHSLCIPAEQAVAQPGGFDVVIGNPPYVRQEGLKDDKAYYETRFITYRSTADIYVYFIEKALHVLNTTGLFGMIVSNKWLRSAYGEGLRNFLVKNTAIQKIVDFAGLPVFSNATVRTIVLICKPLSYSSQETFQYLAPLSLDEFRTIKTGKDLGGLFDKHNELMHMPKSGTTGWSLTDYKTDSLIEHLLSKSISLRTYLERKPLRGIITGFNEAFVIDKTIRERLINSDPKNADLIRPMVIGRDVRRYQIEYKDRFLIWTYSGVPIKDYPTIFEYLGTFEKQLQKRWDKGNYWWELRACDYYEKFKQPKIIYPDIATHCRFTLDTNGYFSTNTTYFIPGNDLYLLGLLNSRLANFYFSTVCAGLEGSGKTYLRFFGQYLENFPVAVKATDTLENQRIATTVDHMLALHRQHTSATTPTEKTMLQRQIDAIDHQIDQLVYQLYGLTDEEIKIVEEAV